MEIEVSQPSGVYVKAFVEQLTQNGVLVSFENNSKPAELCPFDRCRCVLTEGKPNAPYVFKTGDIVDAFMQQADGDQQSIVCAWQKAKVKDVKEELAVVESVEGPQNIDTVNMSSRCRPINSASPITYDSFKQHLIEVPGDLDRYFSDPQTYKDLTDLVKDIHVEYLKETGQIKVVSFSSQSVEKVKMLTSSPLFITCARQKNNLVQTLKKTENRVRKMHRLTERNVSSKCASNSHVSSNCVLEFTVASELMGLAIGVRGTNIANVRKIEGVDKVTFYKRRKENGVCRFKVLARTQDAAEQARSMLEYIKHAVPVPSTMVSQVIGKSHQTIRYILDRSGAVRYMCPKSEETPTNEMIYITFIGTRKAVTKAEQLINSHLKDLKDKEETQELERLAFDEVFSYYSTIIYNGNHNTNSNAFMQSTVTRVTTHTGGTLPIHWQGASYQSIPNSSNTNNYSAYLRNTTACATPQSTYQNQRTPNNSNKSRRLCCTIV
ncbi:KH domain-containing protein [Ditylenchus destructor]|nr:KH domain-containing protein [Ditylenchus destructor]